MLKGQDREAQILGEHIQAPETEYVTEAGMEKRDNIESRVSSFVWNKRATY